jgi:hypothetical protein
MQRKSAAGRATRRWRELTRVPPGSTCQTCGTQRRLHQTAKGVVCYQCRQKARGLSGTEAHHVLGEDVSSTTLRVDANFHRGLEEAKNEWPDEVLQNRDRRVMLLLAGFLLFLRDTGRLLAEWAQAFVDWILGAHRQLQHQYPTGYETALSLPRFHGQL